jgi:hypothetical protein
VATEALRAFADNSTLRANLIFKGARILNLRLGVELRQSMDIDSNLSLEFQKAHPRADEQQRILAERVEAALRRYFGRQEPVRYAVESVQAEPKPIGLDHPFGWNGFLVKVRLRDARKLGVLGLPTLEMDVVAPESLGPDAVSDLAVGANSTLRAYSLPRIAGEKMRAFLSSLPAYQRKIGRRTDSARVKDLYDLVRIHRRHPIADAAFWQEAGREFRMACESRFVDCAGIDTFLENASVTRQLFENDQTLPKDVAFGEVLSMLSETLALFAILKIVPFAHALPGSL